MPTREALGMKHEDDIDSENGGMTYENYGSLGVQLEPRCASHHEYMQIITCLLNASAYSLLHSVLGLVASLRVHTRWETCSRRDDLRIDARVYTYILQPAELFWVSLLLSLFCLTSWESVY